MGLNLPSDSSLLSGEAGLDRAVSVTVSSGGEAQSLPPAPVVPQQPAGDNAQLTGTEAQPAADGLPLPGNDGPVPPSAGLSPSPFAA